MSMPHLLAFNDSKFMSLTVHQLIVGAVVTKFTGLFLFFVPFRLRQLWILIQTITQQMRSPLQATY
jgi:hypothetical protein